MRKQVREGICPECGARVTIDFELPRPKGGYSIHYLHSVPECDRFIAQDSSFLASILESSTTSYGK